jgi:hypothetical protein
MAICTTNRFEIYRRARRTLYAAVVLALASPLTSHATTTTITVQSNLTSSDAWLNQEKVDEKHGGNSDLRIKSTGPNKNRHAAVLIPLPTELAGKTVLQAWLNLSEFGATSSTPIDARVYPLTEAWTEADVTWKNRTSTLLWQTAGGSRLPFWTSRQLVSTSTNLTTVGWQVGPIVNDWNLGLLANNGFLIESDHLSPDREVTFRSSEYTSVPANTPQLVIQYTDEPPAVKRGYAEIRPSQVFRGATNMPFSVWLDVEATGSTPSGPATGFDLITIAHGGALRGVGLDGLIVDGTSIPLNQVTWYDNGTSITVRAPKITIVGRIEVKLRVDVIATEAQEIPVYVDDTTTPGVWQQILWQRNADGVAGNGDTWLLDPSASLLSVQLLPDSLETRVGECTQLGVYAVDDVGNRFPVTADSFWVYYHPTNSKDPTIGTIDANGLFCASRAVDDSAYILVFYAGRFDYTVLTVTPALLPIFSSVTLRNRSGVAVASLTPQDTMFLDVSLSDGDGFKDITGLDFDFSYAGHSADTGAPAFRGSYAWRRGASPPFTLMDPVPSTWILLPSLCTVDTTTNSTSPQTVRLAFRPGAIARASSTGEWTARVSATSTTPSNVTSFSKTGLGMSVKLSVVWDDPSGAFNAGAAGATLLPLIDPTDGKLDVRVLANTVYDLEGRVSDFAGLTTTTDTLRVGSPNKRVSWAFNSDRTSGGRLDTIYGVIAAAQTASVSEAGVALPLYLWLDLPSPLSAQDYRGAVKMRLAAAGGIRSTEPSVPLTATVSNSGAAAQSAVGEVLPHAVQVGVSAQTFTAYLLPTFNPFDTGIDRIRISIPEGYGVPLVTSVRVSGAARSFSDASLAGVAEARLASNVVYSIVSQLIEVRFQVSTPTALDSIGANFVMQFDDLGTSRPPQAAVEGDANGTADGNHWKVTVGPGPIASVSVQPDSVALYPGGTQQFTATAADVYGHPLSPSFSWSALGGFGTVSSAGLFTASSVGSARVVAASGGVSDTSRVTVRPTRGIQIVSFLAPVSLYQGQDSAIVRLTLANLGADSVRLDTLALRLSRVASGDANFDFSVGPAAGNPAGIGGLDTVTVRLSMRVHTDAITGTVTVDGRVVATEVASGTVVRDDQVDTPVTAFVYPGGVTVSAAQVPSTVLPGKRDLALSSVNVTNHFPEARTLRSLRITNRTRGAGDADQLDEELGDLALYKDDGDGVLEAGADTLLLPTVALSGSVTFAPLSLVIPSGATARLLVITSQVPLEARDGDSLDVSLEDSTATEFDRSVFYRNGWSLSPPGLFLLDGMAAAQVKVNPVVSANLLAGSVNNPALDIVVPPNGYEADLLQRVAVVNRGSAEAGIDIARVRAWVDDGNGVFGPPDRLLGDLVYTGDRWQRTGLSEVIPLGGLRLFVTVDLSDLARQGQTVRLAVPYGLDAGLGVQSGNSGPRDLFVENPVDRAISTVDRITFTSAVVPPESVRPGARNVLLHHFIVTNSYSSGRTLTDLVFTNASTGPGTATELDQEIESATLRLDGDGDGTLDDPAVDPPLGTSFFSGGRAVFTGLTAAVPAGAAIHAFLVVDVARNSARDGDALSANVAGPLDVGFLEGTTITAAWPVDSRAHAVIDGMVSTQITNIGAPGVTLGPDDGPNMALNVVVPGNGYEGDRLTNLTVVNLGSASDSTGIAELHLWSDGGDGVFTGAGGDDSDLGTMVLHDNSWTSAVGDTIFPAGRRLFVSLLTSSSPSDSVTVRLGIPFGGVEMKSGNDGPLDAPVENAQSIVISTSPLLARIETGSAASTVGQAIVVRMIVRNAGSETVTGISNASLAAHGTAGAVLDNGPAPTSFDLAPGAVDTLVWIYHSTAAGTVQFAGAAQGTGETSGLLRRAVETSSNVHRVYLAAADLALFPVQSMPFNVTRGQTGVVPFSLTLTNGGGTGASDIRFRSFRVRLEDESGTGIVPSSLLTGVAVNEGTNVYLTRSSLETSGSDLDLTLASPILVTSQEPVTISLRLDISDSTTTHAFRLVLADSTSFVAEDATSGAPVTVRRQNGAFPVVSGLARLVADATELRVSSLGGAPARAARGTLDVIVASLRFENPGTSGITSDVQVGTVGVILADSAGTPVATAASYLSRLVLRTEFQTYAARPIRSDDGAGVTLVLSPPLGIPANTPVDVTLAADIADTARIGTFRVLLQPPTSIEARDANSRDSVVVSYEPDSLSGPPVLIEAEARTLRVQGTPLFPSAVLAGERDVPAIRMLLRHADAAGTGRLRLDSLVVQVRDETRASRVPDVYLDRLRVSLDSVEVANLTSLPVTGGQIAVPLGGALIEPGDSRVLSLTVDFSPSAPVSFLELAVGSSGIVAADANTGRDVTVLPEPGSELPLVSGLTHIASPARDLFAGWQSRMPAALALDGREVAVALLTLRNAAPAGAGLIRLDRLRLSASGPTGQPLMLGVAARFLAAYVNGTLWARSDSLGADSTEATLFAATPLDVDAASTATIEIRLVPQPSPSAGAFRLGLFAAGVGVVQPGSALLTVQVSPEAGSAFPFWTQTASFTPASLAESWGNFPNPFAAGRGMTSFVYYLASEARVSLRIRTPRGDGVATLLDHAPRGAGLQQSDGWDGRNGRGDVVRNGIYVAELIVTYANGTTERARRKVAVVR